MTILIVDDSPTNRKWLRATLEAEGHRAVEAAHGRGALKVLEHAPVDAIISDILMPKMDGFQLCYAVRRGERFRHLPFIMFTSTYTSPSDEKLALEMGADRFVRKPAAAKDLLAILGELKQSARKAPTASMPQPAVVSAYGKRLVAKLQEKNVALLQARSRAEAFAELGQKLNSARTAGAAAHVIVGVADQLLGWDVCTFSLYDSATDMTTPILKVETVDQRRLELTSETVTTRPTARARKVLEQGPQLILRPEPESGVGVVPFGGASRASGCLLAVPVRHGNQILALLSLQSYTPNAYDPQSLNVLKVLADYCGGALHRIRTEAELGQSQEQHRTILRTAMDGFWRVDAQGRLQEVNEAYCRMSGYSEEELLTMSISDLEAGETPVPIAGHLRRIEQLGEHRFESRHRRKDGSSYPVEISVQYRPMEGGQMVIFLRDITERKRAEDDLRKSREQLRALAGRLQHNREEQNQRMAREIHDVLGQALTSLNIDVLWLRHKLASLPDKRLRAELRRRLRSMEPLVRSAVQATQRLSSDLRPGMLDDLGLAATLEWQAQEFARRTGLACRWASKPQPVALNRDQATAIFRIFQEILTNIARHAKAHQVTLGFQQRGHSLVLEVGDDGLGFDEKKLADRESLGLLGMRERALLVGAKLAIRSAPSQGTTLTLTLPLPGSWREPASRTSSKQKAP